MWIYHIPFRPVSTVPQSAPLIVYVGEEVKPNEVCSAEDSR